MFTRLTQMPVGNLKPRVLATNTTYVRKTPLVHAHPNISLNCMKYLPIKSSIKPHSYFFKAALNWEVVNLWRDIMTTMKFVLLFVAMTPLIFAQCKLLKYYIYNNNRLKYTKNLTYMFNNQPNINTGIVWCTKLLTRDSQRVFVLARQFLLCQYRKS